MVEKCPDLLFLWCFHAYFAIFQRCIHAQKVSYVTLMCIDLENFVWGGGGTIRISLVSVTFSDRQCSDFR